MMKVKEQHSTTELSALESLPNETIQAVLSQLPLKELISARLISRNIRDNVDAYLNSHENLRQLPLDQLILLSDASSQLKDSVDAYLKDLDAFEILKAIISNPNAYKFLDYYFHKICGEKVSLIPQDNLAKAVLNYFLIDDINNIDVTQLKQILDSLEQFSSLPTWQDIRASLEITYHFLISDYAALANSSKEPSIYCNLKKAKLYNVELINVQLPGVDLRQANFLDVKLQNCNLQNANLQGANLSLCVFEKNHMQSANLQNTLLNSTSFFETNLQNVCLKDANTRGTVCFDTVDLTNANLIGINLPHYIFSNTEITGAKFVDVSETNQPFPQQLRVISDCLQSPCYEPEVINTLKAAIVNDIISQANHLLAKDAIVMLQYTLTHEAMGHRQFKNIKNLVNSTTNFFASFWSNKSVTLILSDSQKKLMVALEAATQRLEQESPSPVARHPAPK